MSFMIIVSEVVNLMVGFLITQIELLKLKLWSILFPELSQLRLLTVCVQVLGLIFGCEKERIWTSVLHDNCI